MGPVNIYKEIPSVYQKRLKGCHMNRINEFLSARSLLLEFLQEKNLVSNFEKMEEISHQKLKNFPEFTFSFSHTKDMVALVIAESQEHPYLGIDIEKINRPLPPSVTRYLDHPEDDLEVGLEKWTIKEASFKYFSAKLKQENFWFKSIKLKGQKAFFEKESCSFIVQKHHDHLLSIAAQKISLPLPIQISTHNK